MAAISGGPAVQGPGGENMVLRFTLAERLAHWNHAISFLVLLITGGALAFPWAAALLGRPTLLLFGALHRIAAVFFTGVTIPLLWLGARSQAGRWVQESFHFDSDDRLFLSRFWREFFGLMVALPPQGKFNAGEKINSILQILGWPAMVSTGWLLVYKDDLPQAVAQWVLPLHSVAALLLGAAAIGHIYLATLHPGGRPGLTGMTSGWVPARWARHHYRKWYDAINDKH